MAAKRATRTSNGFTLVEVVVVLMILSALAALVVPLFGSLTISTAQGQKSPRQIATEATMHKIRDVIMGTPNHQGVWADLGQRPEFFPTNPDTLLLEQIAGIAQFDPVTKVGWRGPYLVGHSNVIDAWGNPLVIQIPDLNGDGANVSANELEFVRLVSAGESDDDGVYRINTPPDVDVPTVAERGSDIVLFLRMTDPFP